MIKKMICLFISALFLLPIFAMPVFAQEAISEHGVHSLVCDECGEIIYACSECGRQLPAGTEICDFCHELKDQSAQNPKWVTVTKAICVFFVIIGALIAHALIDWRKEDQEKPSSLSILGVIFMFAGFAGWLLLVILF